MGPGSRRASRLRRLLGLALAVGVASGCAGSFASGLRYAWFTPPDRDDAWSRKIYAWQARERGDAVDGTPAQVAGPGEEDASPAAGDEDLRTKYEQFRNERKRALAREMAGWIQAQAPRHYVPDGPIDQWATLEQTLRQNGDDCDGLELLTYYFLRDLGFAADEVFRAIVYRRSDGQHHMVTLWFEDPEDPWVIDPTGAMTLGMPRMSEVPGWVPLKVFGDDQDYTVRLERLAATPSP